jgi:hypothetical protein
MATVLPYMGSVKTLSPHIVSKAINGRDARGAVAFPQAA